MIVKYNKGLSQEIISSIKFCGVGTIIMGRLEVVNKRGGVAMSRNTNNLVVENSRDAMARMKFEIASELGIPDYDRINKGELPSRVNGYVGGNMTKRLVAIGQAAISGTAIDLNSVGLETPTKQ